MISIGTRQAGRLFGPDDGEALELLAGMAASMLGTLERAQLQAVSLAARELAHRLNNDLVLAVGTIDMLRDEPALRREVRELIAEAADGLERVGAQLGGSSSLPDSRPARRRSARPWTWSARQARAPIRPDPVISSGTA